MFGKLYLVATPIGNIKDITFRAVEILTFVDLILAEDTRKTLNLCSHYNIKTKLLSHHKFNEHKYLDSIANKLQSGLNIALVSDAGTPGISDPGFLLARHCINENIEVISIPGASAILTAITNSGFPCDRFCFEGFLPQKKGRLKKWQELKAEKRTIVIYESPYRLLKTLNEIKTYIDINRKICISRELTKIYEENIRGTADELIQYFENKGVKGEIVIIIEQAPK